MRQLQNFPPPRLASAQEKVSKSEESQWQMLKKSFIYKQIQNFLHNAGDHFPKLSPVIIQMGGIF